MGEFEQWQRWGLELSDKEFANAFVALGILAASSNEEKLAEDDVCHQQKDSEIDQQILEFTLAAAVKARIVLPGSKDFLISWIYPRSVSHVQIGPCISELHSLNPKQLASSWKNVCTSFSLSPRFQVTGQPLDEQVLPWFRLLFEAVPKKKSAYIETGTEQSPLRMKWPLRFGFLADDPAETITKSTVNAWPSKELAKAVRIDRDNANCDVLVSGVNSGQLLKKLLDMPGRRKSSLIIIRGRPEEYQSSLNRRLLALQSESSASGYVFLHPDTTDEAMSDALNRFVENLSHNQPLDIAVSEAFTERQKADPAIFLSHTLATFQIESVLEKIKSRLYDLPEAARPQMRPETFHRMGIPADGMKEDLSNPAHVAKKIDQYKKAVHFYAESTGALGMVEMTMATEHAEDQIVKENKYQRFLQEQVLIKKQGKYTEERRAFLKDVSTLIRVRIGPPDKKWNSMGTEFPDEKLPKDRNEWNLTVVLSEPNHLKEPLRGTIKLPKFGPSKECEFRVRPGDHSIFEGRITILHRGRVLQTGVIVGEVVGQESEIPVNSKIELKEKIAVRANIGDLEDRRQFDLAVVLNHTSDERPRLTAIADDHAWCVDLAECKKIVVDINTALSKVARSVEDYSTGFVSDKNRALLVELANLGNALHWSLVEEQFKVAKNRPDIAEQEYIQIVSTKSDAIVPFEFIYDDEAPDDDATPCPSWKDALANASCRSGCKIDRSKHVCPLGFWGVRKVIERHDMTPELAQDGKEFFIQSESTKDRQILSIMGTAVLAASTKVEDKAFDPVFEVCTKRLGSPPQKAADWDEWAAFVQKYKPHLLLALTHTDGDGIGATLEIGGKTIKSNKISEMYVRPEGMEDFPLVALLGCDTEGTALEYGSHVRWFRRKGAGVVIGTIATVYGGHAAKVAEMLIRGLTAENARPERLGEVIRSIKRQALLDGMLMPLCVVAYGDADWKLS